MSQAGTKRSRRSFLRNSATLAAGALVAPTILRGARAQGSGGQVVFTCPGGLQQTLFQQFIIPKFTAQTGIKIEYVPSQPNDIVAKLRAQRGTSGIDCCWLGGAATYTAIDQGLLQTLDTSLIPNAANLDPKVGREPQIMPIAVSGNCLIYKKDVYASKGWQPPTSWFDLWDTRLAKHTGMYSLESTGGVEMLLEVAKELTGDYNNLDPAFAKFRALRDNVYQFFASPGPWETAMQQGTLWLGVNSYTRAIQLVQAGWQIGVVLPRSGLAEHQVPIGIPAGASNTKGAHAWTNYLLSKETQQIILEKIGYAPATLGVTVPPDIAGFLPKPEQTWFPDWRKVSGEFDKLVDRWQREVED